MKAIREGLAANLASLNGSSGVQVSAYLYADPNLPAVQVLPGAIAYDETMARGYDRYSLTVQALAPLGQDVTSQQILDQMIDEPDSVKALIEADRTLGGAADDLRVSGCSGYQVVTLEGRGPLLFCEWTVDVYAKSN
jgi:hypothetical protein